MNIVNECIEKIAKIMWLQDKYGNWLIGRSDRDIFRQMISILKRVGK